MLEELYPEFPGWSMNLERFLESYHPESFTGAEETSEIRENIKQIYATILDAIIRMSGIRDRWEGPEFLPLNVYAGQEAYFRSTKLECPFHFGTDESGFFLSTDLIYSENLRKMNDKFWFLVAELTNFGELDIWENTFWEDTKKRKQPWFHRKSGSRIFQLIRSSVALEKEEGDSAGIGMLIIRWDFDTPWDELLDKGSAAFQNLYRINKALKKKKRHK